LKVYPHINLQGKDYLNYFTEALWFIYLQLSFKLRFYFIKFLPQRSAQLTLSTMNFFIMKIDSLIINLSYLMVKHLHQIHRLILKYFYLLMHHHNLMFFSYPTFLNCIICTRSLLKLYFYRPTLVFALLNFFKLFFHSI
jgi:hypothetical protein